MTWHADPTLLAAYADGGLDLPRAASVETHLVACAPCQSAVAAHVAETRVDRIWGDIADIVDAPRVGWAERTLRRIGMSESSARLVAATPQLRASWVSAITLVMLLAVLASGTDGLQRLFFLAVAPVLPVVAVGIAFSSRFDPMAEITAAAPVGASRLLAARGVASLAPTVAVAAVAAAVVPGVVTVAWLLPGLALCAIGVAAATWVDAVDAAAAIAAAWLAVVSAVEIGARRPQFGAAVAQAVASPTGQLAAAAVLIAAAAVVATRRQCFDLRRS